MLGRFRLSGDRTREGATEAALIHFTGRGHGGTETHVYHLAMALVRAGVEVVLASHRQLELDPVWADELRGAGIESISPPSWSRYLPGELGLVAARLKLLVRLGSRRFNCVVGQGHGAAFAWMRRFVGAGGAMIWHEHWDGLLGRNDDEGYEAPCRSGRLPSRELRMIYSVDLVLADCQRAADNLRTVQAVKKPMVILPPLDRITALPAVERSYTAESTIQIGIVGRQGAGKGTFVLLDMWPSLVIGPAVLHIVGPFTCKEEEQGARERAAEISGVRVHGRVERTDLGRILGDLDLGLLVSTEEGYGLVVCEYMANGVPFVMTDVGAATEFSTNNPDCVVVSVEPQAVGRGIEDMVARLRAGDISRVRLQEYFGRFYDYERTVEQYLSVFQLGRTGGL